MSNRQALIRCIDEYFKGKNYYPKVPWRPIGKIVVEEVERMGRGGLYLSTACGLLEKENGGKNVFGCDAGSLFCNQTVTRERVQRLLRAVDRGAPSNGVGHGQPTYPPLLKQIEAAGGAHRPELQMRICFAMLNGLIETYGWQGGAAAYNAGAANRMAVYETYGADMVRLEREWAGRLEEASGAGALEPPDRTRHKKPRRDSNFAQCVKIMERVVGGPRQYWVWSSGPVPAGVGMYAINRPLRWQDIGDANCAGIINACVYRQIGVTIPTLGDENYDGGVLAYAGGVWAGQAVSGYYAAVEKPFHLERAKSVAEETGCGVLIMRRYTNPTLAGQGHVAVLMPSGYVFQSHVNAAGPDINWDYRIEASHAGGFYQSMVLPDDFTEGVR